MKLKKLKKGSLGRVSGFITEDRSYREKLLRMGLTKGAEFTLIRTSFFRGPVELEVKGSRLVLRSDEADGLEVEAL
ncbi:MAG: ferrous iron transport protein A [Kiritimatiellaceae bacterium]|jgi:ferrous iron transport protein A|nr:ferrous iron transport protein A [Kiritimatiellaceae bacterium]|tara:strand:- start:621 stop:848 length:228 start_codon:yes stop_codon:yes gene_type:complete